MQENKRHYTMETGIQEVLSLVLSSSKPVLVLVAGGSCSGKGYFSDRLEKLSMRFGISVSTINMDGCFRDIDDPVLPYFGKTPIFDVPDSYHLDEIRKYVLDLILGKDIRYPEYDVWNNRRKKEKFNLIRSSDLIIVDGLFAISELADLGYCRAIKIFVEADESIRMKRRIDRDEKYGVNRDLIKSVFLDRIAPLHMIYVEPQRSMADIVIVNN